MPHSAHEHREQGQDGDLGHECFGRGDADLEAACMYVPPSTSRAMVLPTTLTMPRVLWPLRRIRGRRPGCRWFHRLADGKDEGVFVDGGIAVTELAGVVGFGGDAGELFHQVFADHAGVERGAQAVKMMRSTERSSGRERFRPPSRRGFIVADAPRRAFSMTRGCSKISLSMKCGYLPRSTSSAANSTSRTWG